MKIPEAVKARIISALRGSYNRHQLSNGTESLRLSRIDGRFLWACSSNGTSETILTWHIATCLLEVRPPCQHGQEGSPSDLNDKIIATHLSKYCAYLMAWSPDLLPDDDEWSKSLYDTVKKDAKRALAGRTAEGLSLTPVAEYEQVAQLLLSVNSKYDVLKNGVRLGKQLLADGEDTAWKVLAEFWSGMVLYIAPSDNVRGHLKATARGGELITLLWALLTHAGISSWPDDAGDAATADARSAR